MDVKETLKRIGMRRNEIKVYLGLLKLGSSKAGKISKIAEVNRTNTYDALKSLLEKGLASYVVIANKKWFQPAHPRRLKELLKEMEDDVSEVLPQLEGIFKQTQLKQNVTLYKGLKGIKSVMQDILREGKNNDVFGSEGQFGERMPIYEKQFLKLQKEQKIRTRMLVRRGRKAEGSRMTEVRFVPKNVESPVVTNIYGNKIAIIIWTDTPEATIIENKAAADSYRAYFELLWKQGKK
ncbi:MAG: helix-turn-helix domain-containing protein [Candidatus Woesearchaeota archaeon]